MASAAPASDESCCGPAPKCTGTPKSDRSGCSQSAVLAINSVANNSIVDVVGPEEYRAHSRAAHRGAGAGSIISARLDRLDVL